MVCARVRASPGTVRVQLCVWGVCRAFPGVGRCGRWPHGERLQCVGFGRHGPGRCRPARWASGCHSPYLRTTDADVGTPGWNSRRLVFRDAGMGYSVNDTVIKPGAELEMAYRHHLETVYCIEGEGQITDLGSGRTHDIRPGTLYALNRHDHHVLRANKGVAMRMVCVFNPPLTGREMHDATGAYAAAD